MICRCVCFLIIIVVAECSPLQPLPTSACKSDDNNGHNNYNNHIYDTAIISLTLIQIVLILAAIIIICTGRRETIISIV